MTVNGIQKFTRAKIVELAALGAAGRHSGTIALATCSGVGSVSGSTPGKAERYMRVRVGPGANKLARTLVFAHSAA